MKTNSTLVKYAMLIIVVLAFAMQLKAQTPTLNFNSTPTLISGSNLAIGSKYRFNNVLAGTSAVVTIVSATGGTSVAMLDDNGATKPEAFSPQINIPGNSNGMVQFKLEFFIGNTNTPRLIDTLRATAMDIDGTSTIKEMDAINMGGGLLSFYSGSLEINVTQTGSEFLGTNIAGINYPGVDTSAKKVMYTVTNTGISSFTYKAGANNQGGSTQTRLKGIYFKGFNYSAPLAVKYSSFDALVVDKTVLLKWITEQEINNNHFEVERSFDGTNFTTIGIVLDGFENGTKKSYQFKDNTTELQSKTVIYYRLKQIDNDGKISYTNILVVKLQAKTGVVMQTTPNPFTENLSVRFTATENGNVEINIININGQKILSKQTSISKGFNTLQLNGLGNLASGMYVAQLTMNGVVVDNQKIIKN